MGDAGILEAADANMRFAWATLCAASGGADIVEDGDALFISTGSPVAFFNPVFQVGATKDAGEFVAKALEFYAARGVPFLLRSRDELSPSMADAATAAGLTDDPATPVMVLDPIPDPLPETPEAAQALEIRDVGPADLAAYSGVISEAFSMPADMVERYFGPKVWQADGITGFLGLLDGQPVATSALILSDGVAGVYNVGTVEAQRKRGYGEALTWAAIAAGRAAGCATSILQASPLGRPVYERMGFTTPDYYRQFLGGSFAG